MTNTIVAATNTATITYLFDMDIFATLMTKTSLKKYFQIKVNCN